LNFKAILARVLPFFSVAEKRKKVSDIHRESKLKDHRLIFSKTIFPRQMVLSPSARKNRREMNLFSQRNYKSYFLTIPKGERGSM
jgi:hypothetical protein